jgi:N6-adenosine-specific RNA methylase IME4
MAKTEIIDPKQTKITDWYNKLLDDLWELAQTKVIEMKHATGKRIIKDWDKFGKPEYGDIFIENLAKDLKISSSDLYKCIQFARKFPELQNCYSYIEQLEDSVTGYKIHKLTWKYIIKDILPEHKKQNVPLPLPKGKYNVILADPPWKYTDTCEKGAIQSKGADKHYKDGSLTIQQLSTMDVPYISAKDSILFLWTTSPMLEDSFKVINSWGFKYKASFIWDKIKHNMGHYNSVRHEFLLLCIKGSFQPEELKLFDSVISMEKTKKHSEKPDIFYEMIETLYPTGKKIELFARNKRDGWDSWGNEL